jgi:hypothetical protein
MSMSSPNIPSSSSTISSESSASTVSTASTASSGSPVTTDASLTNTTVPNPTQLPDKSYDFNENLSKFFEAFLTLFSKFGEYFLTLIFGLPSDSPPIPTPTPVKSSKIKGFNYREFFEAFQTLFFSFVLVALIYRVFVSLAKII